MEELNPSAVLSETVYAKAPLEFLIEKNKEQVAIKDLYNYCCCENISNGNKNKDKKIEHHHHH